MRRSAHRCMQLPIVGRRNAYLLWLVLVSYPTCQCVLISFVTLAHACKTCSYTSNASYAPPLLLLSVFAFSEAAHSPDSISSSHPSPVPLLLLPPPFYPVFSSPAPLPTPSGGKVNFKDCHWLSPLHHAAARGHEATVKELIRQQADVMARDKNWMTPLHMAAHNNHLGCAGVCLVCVLCVYMYSPQQWTIACGKR